MTVIPDKSELYVNEKKVNFSCEITQKGREQWVINQSTYFSPLLLEINYQRDDLK